MNFAFTPPAQAAVPVKNSDSLFPVHRIYCIGKNYADHIREMGGTPERQPPVFFMKPADAICLDNQVPYPPATSNYHYEAELVIAIGESGSNIRNEDALQHVFGYAIGSDMTRRDLQTQAARAGNPWDTGKSFDFSAPLSPVTKVEDCGHFDSGSLQLSVNGELRQDADFSDLIWKNEEIIARLSELYELKAGDLIFTGTPAGVGAVAPGDKLVIEIDRLGSLEFTIGPR